MSSDSTKVPGMDSDAGGRNFYSRNSARQGTSTFSAPHKGTVVPGMEQYAPGAAPRPSASKSTFRVPVVGFLYSISRQGVGEYWPLHVGTNKIGRTGDNDIVLAESTVSERHAALNIKQLKSTGKLLASIRDEGSKNGIYVNDEELDYDAHEVKNGDIVTIGDNYRLLVIIIDAASAGLSIAEDFRPCDEDEEPEDDGTPFHAPMPDDTGSLYNSANRVQNGTVAMDGSVPETSGRTRFL